MISCVNVENSHLFGKALHTQFRLRYEAFIERQSYDVNIFNRMEYDQYDTPASTYLIYHTSDGTALASSRLYPTQQGCMLKDLWPDMVEDKSLLKSDKVWEGTRYCIDKSVDSELRQKIIAELAIAYVEFGKKMELDMIIGMMPTFIYRSVFERPGIKMLYLGEVKAVGDFKTRAVAIPINDEQIRRVREKNDIHYPVLKFSNVASIGEYNYERAA